MTIYVDYLPLITNKLREAKEIKMFVTIVGMIAIVLGMLNYRTYKEGFQSSGRGYILWISFFITLSTPLIAHMPFLSGFIWDIGICFAFLPALILMWQKFIMTPMQIGF